MVHDTKEVNVLEGYRETINIIDRQLIELLSKRFETVRKIGAYKKERNMPPLQPARWREVLDSRRAWALEQWLDPDWVERIWNELHKYALVIEEK